MRRALTILEVLVVLFIIGLLAALLLPAIQRARMSAHRVTCTSKLRQIGVALHNYTADSRYFPPALLLNTGWLGGPWSEKVALLPYLDQNALYDSINLGLSSTLHPANTTLSGMSPSVYLCPSDEAPAGPYVGVASYVGCAGSGLWPHGYDAVFTNESFPMNGMAVTSATPIAPSDVTDGLANTVYMGEMIHGANYQQQPVEQARGVVWMFVTGATTQAQFVEDCDLIHQTPGAAHAVAAGWKWTNPLPARYTHLRTPNQRSCWALGSPLGDTLNPITASSRHEQGVNVLFCDGHVRFVSDSVSVDTWRASGSRNGREMVGF